MGTHPGVAEVDTDGDILPDAWETQHSMDPNDSDQNDDTLSDHLNDFDKDSLSNFDELLHGTDPWEADSDGDGLPDYWEIENGLDPNDALGPNGAAGDFDGDGQGNQVEFFNNTPGNVSNADSGMRPPTDPNTPNPEDFQLSLDFADIGVNYIEHWNFTEETFEPHSASLYQNGGGYLDPFFGDEVPTLSALKRMAKFSNQSLLSYPLDSPYAYLDTRSFLLKRFEL